MTRETTERATSESTPDFSLEVATRQISLLERLVAGVLHEVNSPLAVLSTNTQLLEHAVDQSRNLLESRSREPETPDPDNVIEVLETIGASQKEACERIVETLQSLKTCVSLDEANWKLVDVSQHLNSVIQLLQNSLGRTFEVTKSFEGSYFVEGSSHKLSQLFMNLLLNGMEAAGADGHVEVSVEETERNVIVTFRDSGDGIHPADLPEIFTAGFSGSGTDSAGLGLTICRYIVKEHRGTLKIESEPGVGVKVHVILPKSQ